MLKSFSVLAVAALVFAAPVLARADAASKHAKVEEMLRVTKMDDHITQVMEQTKGQIQDLVDEQRAGAAQMPPEQGKIMNDFEVQVSALMMNALKLEDIHPLMAKLYEDTYTEEELDGILAFYKTPSGQALLTKTPDLMDKVMGMVQQRISALSPQVEKLADDMQKKMAAAQHGGPAGAADAPAVAPPPAPKQ